MDHTPNLSIHFPETGAERTTLIQFQNQVTAVFQDMVMIWLVFYHENRAVFLKQD